MVNRFILIIIFLMIFISFLADPAPVSIEIEDIILVFLPLLAAFSCLFTSDKLKINKMQYALLIGIMIYACSLVLSLLIGLAHGVSLLNVLRASGPYLNFFPLLIVGFFSKRFLDPWSIASILIFVGLVQSFYHLYIYAYHTGFMGDTMDVLRGRITLVDTRTTIPILLSTSILPFSYFSRNLHLKLSSLSYQMMLSCVIFIGFFGVILTLTRAIMLAVLVGWLCFFILYSYHLVSHRIINFHKLLYNFFLYGLLLLFVFVVVYRLPIIHTVLQGLLTRFYHSASYNHGADYSNGRLYDEWIPALSTWADSDILGWIFGIGAGNTFIVAMGETRTYIHNLTLYSLVYGGLVGLVTCFLFYLIAFRTFVLRAYHTGQIIYYGFASLLMSLFFYGQLFAVHKGLAFNAMLFVMVVLALCSHRELSSIR